MLLGFSFPELNSVRLRRNFHEQNFCISLRSSKERQIMLHTIFLTLLYMDGNIM